MKWEFSSYNGQHEVYDLKHKDKKLLTLDFHPNSNSARIQYADEKRVFLMRREGFRKNKFVLRNEYGMRIGKIFNDSIDLEDEHYTYAIQNNTHPELVVYKEATSKPYIVCEIKSNNGTATAEFTNGKQLNPSGQFLLMALCWYMFQPVAKENAMELAT